MLSEQGCAVEVGKLFRVVFFKILVNIGIIDIGIIRGIIRIFPELVSGVAVPRRSGYQMIVGMIVVAFLPATRFYREIF
jgi:hypothetical protein